MAAKGLASTLLPCHQRPVQAVPSMSSSPNKQRPPRPASTSPPPSSSMPLSPVADLTCHLFSHPRCVQAPCCCPTAAASVSVHSSCHARCLHTSVVSGAHTQACSAAPAPARLPWQQVSQCSQHQQRLGVSVAACTHHSYRVASVRTLPQVPAGSMDYTTFSWRPFTARLKGMALSGGAGKEQAVPQAMLCNSLLFLLKAVEWCQHSGLQWCSKPSCMHTAQGGPCCSQNHQ